MSESSLYFKPRLTAAKVDLARDLIAVAHPAGGTSDDMAINLTELGNAIGGAGGAINPALSPFVVNQPATGQPSELRAFGSDTNVGLKLASQGVSGVIQLGRTTLGVPYWTGVGYALDVEIYGIGRAKNSIGLYIDQYMCDVPAARPYAAMIGIASKGTEVNGSAQFIALNTYATPYPPLGVTHSRADGIYAVAGNWGPGALGNATGVGAYINNKGGGSLNYAFALYVYSTFNQGGATVTNNYGLYVSSQTAGANNWAIYTGAGKCEFTGQVLAKANNNQIVFPDADPLVVGAGYWSSGVLTRSAG